MVKKPVLTIDKVDLKEGAKKKLEDIVEAHPVLRESFGVLFQSIIPLDVALSTIESAEVGDNGQLKIVVSLRRDIVIPLKFDESTRLAEKLNELIPLAKVKARTLIF